MLALGSIVLLLTACAAHSPPPAQAPPEQPSSAQAGVEHTIGDRTYLLTVPADLPSGPVPLVVMLHGGFGSGAQAEASYGWDELAASEGFIVAYPNGLGRAWNVGGGCCGKPGRVGTDDVAFVEAVISDVSATSTIDPTRIYATGMSNGALLSYRLACNTDTFAAIASVAGTIVGECDSPTATSVLEIHGLADQSVRMDGAPGAGTSSIDGMPVSDVNALWRTVDGCPDPDIVTINTVTTSTAACADGHTVELITVDGAGHQWPGSDPVRDGAETPSTALDATRTIWEFFTAAG